MTASRVGRLIVSTVFLALAGLVLWVWLAGWRLDRVATNSMAPAIPRGSLVVLKPVAPASVRVGDVVAYREAFHPTVHVVHRVVEANRGSVGHVFRTQGDANGEPDRELVMGTALVGEPAFVLPHGGGLAQVITDPRAPAVLLGLPLVWFMVALVRSRRATARSPRPSFHRS
jgi:signal peptidase I